MVFQNSYSELVPRRENVILNKQFDYKVGVLHFSRLLLWWIQRYINSCINCIIFTPLLIKHKDWITRLVVPACVWTQIASADILTDHIEVLDFPSDPAWCLRGCLSEENPVACLCERLLSPLPPPPPTLCLHLHTYMTPTNNHHWDCKKN